jgi:hypothetical protein
VLGDFRDVAIIILAVVSLISLGLMVALFLAVLSFLRRMRHDFQPLLSSGKATVDTFRGAIRAFQAMAEPMQQLFLALLPMTRAGRVGTQVVGVWQIVRRFLRRTR